MGSVLYLCYQAAIAALRPVIAVRYRLKAKRQSAYRDRMDERFGALPSGMPAGAIWIHAVSVGETNAAAPLASRLLDAEPGSSVLMTCVTPTASGVIQSRFGGRVAHFYAPIDTAAIVSRFFEQIRPRVLVIVETELWPNLIMGAIQRSIPVVFANMRISDATFRRALRVRPLCEHVLKEVSAFCVQTQTDGERAIRLGANAERVHVTGNLKFDMPAAAASQSVESNLRRVCGADRSIIIMGSSHEGEEALFMELFCELRKKFPNVAGIVVPRHPERFDAVFETMLAYQYTVVRRSDWDQDLDDPVDLVLVDAIGELAEFYAAAEVAIVGGSFVPIGGHNILEPIQAGTPVIFGPHMANFREISKLALAAEAGFQARSADDLLALAEQFLGDRDRCQKAVRNGRKMFESNRGSLDKTHEVLQRVVH